MKTTLLAAALAVPCIPAAAAAQQPGPPPAAAEVRLPSVQLPPELDRVLRDYERAWQARDAAALAALFTGDGMVLGNGRPPARGSDAVRRAYTGAGGPLSLRAFAFAAGDTVGYIIGAFAEQAGQPDAGKFVLALRRTPGAPWRIAADIDNLNQMPRRTPAPGAAPAAPPGPPR
jgi:ketosteroid isomerase-like protein